MDIVIDNSITIDKDIAQSNDDSMAVVTCFGLKRNKVAASQSCKKGFFRKLSMRKGSKLSRKMKREKKENVDPCGETRQTSSEVPTSDAKSGDLFPQRHESPPHLVEVYATVVADQYGDIYSVPVEHESPHLDEIYATVRTASPEHLYAVPVTVSSPNNTMASIQVPRRKIHIQSGTRYEIYETSNVFCYERLPASHMTSLLPADTAVAKTTSAVHATTAAQGHHGAEDYRARSEKPSSSDNLLVDPSCTVCTDVAILDDDAEYDQDTVYNEGTQYTKVASYNEGTQYTKVASYNEGTQYTRVASYNEGTQYTKVASYNDSTEDAPDTLNNEGTKYTQVASYNDSTEDTPYTLYNEGTKYTQVASYNESIKDTICIALQFDSTISTQVASYYDTIHNNSVVTVARSTYGDSGDSTVPLRYPFDTSELYTSELEESRVSIRSKCFFKDNNKVVENSKRYRPNATYTLGKYDYRIDVENLFGANVPFSSTMLPTPRRILSDDSEMSNIEETDLETGLNHNQMVIRALRGVSTAGTTTDVTHGASILAGRGSAMSSLGNDRTLTPQRISRGRNTVFRERTRRRIDFDLDITMMNQANERPALEGESFLETAQRITTGQYAQAASTRPSRPASQKAARGCYDRINCNCKRDPCTGEELVSNVTTRRSKRTVGNKLQSTFTIFEDI